MTGETTHYPHICSRSSLPCRNTGGNTPHLDRNLRLTVYVLVFLHAFFAVPFLNSDFAHAQNSTQVSESAQKQEKPQISLSPAERAWLAQNHTVRVRVFDYPPFMIASGGEPKGISFDFLRFISERTGINFAFIKETLTFDESFESLKKRKGPDLLPSINYSIEREAHVTFSKVYYSSPRVIYTKNDEKFIFNMDDLANKTIAVNRGISLLI